MLQFTFSLNLVAIKVVSGISQISILVYCNQSLVEMTLGFDRIELIVAVSDIEVNMFGLSLWPSLQSTEH